MNSRLGLLLAALLRWWPHGSSPAQAPHREATRLDPSNARAHEGIGHALMARNNLADAETEFRAAIQFDPSLGAAHAGLASVLHHTGRTPEALVSAREALRLGQRTHWILKQFGLVQ